MNFGRAELREIKALRPLRPTLFIIELVPRVPDPPTDSGVVHGRDARREGVQALLPRTLPVLRPGPQTPFRVLVARQIAHAHYFDLRVAVPEAVVAQGVEQIKAVEGQLQLLRVLLTDPIVAVPLTKHITSKVYFKGNGSFSLYQISLYLSQRENKVRNDSENIKLIIKCTIKSVVLYTTN